MNIRIITPTLHGALDYVASLVLIVAPFVLSLEEHSVLVHWLSVIAGTGLLIYSLLTDYKISLFGFFSFKQHLVLDGIASTTFILVGLLHEGDVVSTVYSLVMGLGVIFVIGLSNQNKGEISTL